MRASEVTRVRIEDTRLDLGEVAIYRPKTDDPDHMPITARLDTELLTWVTAYAGELGDVPLSGDMLLFPPGSNLSSSAATMRPDSTHPARGVASTRIRRPARTIQRYLPAVVSPAHGDGCHTVRRFSARQLFEHISSHTDQPGYDNALRVTAALLGRKSTVTTELLLGKNMDREKRDTISRGGDFLPPEPAPSRRGLRVVS